MSETLSYDVTKFKIGGGVVKLGTTALGATDGAVTIKAEFSYYESKCNQAGEQVLRKIITGIKYKISAKFKEIDTAIVAALGSTKKVGSSLIGTDLYDNAAELSIAEVGGNNTHTFPAAVVLPESFNYAIDGTAEHGIDLEFEAIPARAGENVGFAYIVTTATSE